jgi:hypothetical protein
MLTATLVGLGATPGGYRKSEFDIGPMKKFVAPLLDGPRWVIEDSPWNFSDNNKPFVLALTQQQFIGDPKLLAIQRWVGQKLGYMAQEWRARCAMGKFPGGTFPDMHCRKKYKSWSINVELPWHVWQGKIPIAKTKHPVTGKEWGFYVAFADHKVTITFKEIPPGLLERLFGAIWDFITTVVGFIVDAVSTLLDWIKTLGCALVRPHMAKLHQVATGALSPTAALSSFSSFGVSKSDLEKIATGATSGLVKTVSDKVINGVCGAPSKTTYPSGSVMAFEPVSKKWLVAAPKGAKSPGLKGAGFGATAGVDESKKYIQVASVTAKPTSLITVTLAEYKELLKGPWYTRTTTWLMFGAGAVAAAGGAYYITRPKAE